MWLVAGLGNPGSEYEGTRHNLGFRLVEELGRRWGVRLSRSGQALAGRGRAGEVPVVLVKPLAYMNRSGEIVGPMAGRERVPPERVLVVLDDMDLPLGTVRYRPSGSSGGHRGLDSVLRGLGSQAVPRIRVGIGRPTDRDGSVSHVLSRFTASERALVEGVIEAAADLAEGVLGGRVERPSTIKLAAPEEKKEEKER